MSKPILNVHVDDYFSTVLDVLGHGGFLGPETSEHHFTLAHGNNKIVFDGTFTPSGGAVSGGTITGFHIYKGGVLSAESSGYAIDVDDLAAAIEQLRDFDNGDPLDAIFDAHGLAINTFGDSEVYGTPYGDIFHGSPGGDGFSGGAGNDKAYGGAGKDGLLGGADNDKLYGGKGSDHIDGGSDNDQLFGGNGNDVLEAGGGLDVMTGGAGKDKFVFNTEVVQGNFAKVTDFQIGFDKLLLGIGVFGFDQPGPLAKSAFHVGPAAHDATDRIIYNADTGALYLDSDGNGDGAMVKFGVLDKHLDLKASDFELIPGV